MGAIESRAPMVNRRQAWTRRAAALSALVLLAVSSVHASESYAGSDTCKTCHEAEWTAWQGSHHYKAMLPATADNVLGDFSGTRFTYGDTTSRFFKRDGKFMVETDDADGELQAFEIAYTFGFYPLQQYLVAFPRGRYQALNIVWDSRPKEDGGQRWMHLYPTDMAAGVGPVEHGDLVHWTGSFQNWNSRCAACHSTGLDKGYASASDSYDTKWQEINVACEACHGPAKKHLGWAQEHEAGEAYDEDTDDSAGEHAGFEFSLKDRGAFGPAQDGETRIFSRLDGKHPVTQVETCAACHSRRSEMGPARPGARFEDQYRLALIEPGLYFPDGQVRDEVYVYGSFLQSKMYAAGVVCTNCHEPHSNKVRTEGNGLCGQCHVPAVFDRPEHYHHESGQPGSACVDCHMPSRTYMVVDDRRDHSFHVPEPILSVALGTPNACDRCHEDKGAEWAAEAVKKWKGDQPAQAKTTPPQGKYAPVMAAAWAGDPAALPNLLSLAGDPAEPAILRASAILASSGFPSQQTLGTAAQLLSDDNALLRASTVRSLEWLRPEQRLGLFKHLATDESKAVRNAVARQLAGAPRAPLSNQDREALAALDKEYLATLRFNADMPEAEMNLGLWYQANGDAVSAEQAYRKALKLAPAYVPAMMNLADLYRATGLDAKAEPLLLEAVRRAPGEAPPLHAIGLLRVRQGKLDEALPYLEQAARADPANVRYAYVYSVALWEAGQRSKAVSTLESLLASHPGHPDLVSALASYYQQLGEQDKLRALREQYPPR
ncbi:MAG: tetratricopeptide repeat protein [Lysobacterales bacterium]